MGSTSTQFETSRRMGLFEPYHQIDMWEDSFKSHNIPLNSSPLPPIIQVQSNLDNNEEQLEPSRDIQETNYTSTKVQRRLAQNREAARKSRLRKKAYVQQLETSRSKLAQLEQELDKARQQSAHIGLPLTVNSGIVAFEIEYRHWVEEQQKNSVELRNMLQAHTSDVQLQILVERSLHHYYDLFRMKGDAAKADIFYLISGSWRSSVERLFLWIGGFRPSELVNVVIPQIEPLTDQQLLAVSNLRLSSQQAEEALSQGMEKLQQSLAMIVTVDPTDAVCYSSHMVAALEQLEALESFVNQADHLRQQTLQHMSRILTIRQAARGLVALGEYFQRLRAISSLWAARPHEAA